MEDVKGKGKRGLVRLVFGRTTFFILFTALQITVLLWIYLWLDAKYQAYGYSAFGLVSAALAVRILNEKQNASFKMAWLVPVLLFPVLCVCPAPDGDKDRGQENFRHPVQNRTLPCTG